MYSPSAVGSQVTGSKVSIYVTRGRPVADGETRYSLVPSAAPTATGRPRPAELSVFFVRYALKLYSTSLRRWLLWCSLAIPEAETVKSVRTDALDAMGHEWTRSDRFASDRIGSIGEAAAANRLCLFVCLFVCLLMGAPLCESAHA